MWPSPAAAGLAPPWHKTFPKDLYGKWWWRLWRMITSRPVGGWSLYEVRIKWLANKCQQDDFSRWCLIFRWSKNQDYDINDLHIYIYIYIVYIYIVNVHIMNHWIWQLRQHVHHHMIIIYSYHNLSYQYNYNPLLWCCCLATSNVQAGRNRHLVGSRAEHCWGDREIAVVWIHSGLCDPSEPWLIPSFGICLNKLWKNHHAINR